MAPSFVPRALPPLHYLAPVIVSAGFAVTLIRGLLAVNKAVDTKDDPRRRRGFLVIKTAVTLSFFAELVVYTVHAFLERGWWVSQDKAIYIMGSTLVWGCLTFLYFDTEKPALPPFFAAWSLACMLDLTICILSDLQLDSRTITPFDSTRRVLYGLRTLLLLLLIFFAIISTVQSRRASAPEDDENQPLLGNASAPADEDAAEAEDETERDKADKKIREMQKKRLEEAGGWMEYLKGFKIFMPYVWPAGNLRVQLYIVTIGGCLLVERVINLLVPIQLGRLTDALATAAVTRQIPWKEIGYYFLLRLVESRAGLSSIQWLCESYISWWSFREIEIASFGHVMDLSMDFHVGKDSGELLTAINQATSINTLLTLILFNTSPIVLDLVIALVYLTYSFDAYFAFVLITVGVIYTTLSIKLTSRTTGHRRQFVEKARDRHKMLYQTVSNWQTVSYFNRQSHEVGRFGEILDKELSANNKYAKSLLLLRSIQELVLLAGRLTVSFLAAWRITDGAKPVGSFITLNAYWGTTTYPLSTISSSYKEISNRLADAERLLQLLLLKSNVPSGDDKFEYKGAEVTFKDVGFRYDERKSTLANINFTAKPGQTVALVGETGSGKSTILKLLYRFYDVSEGSIEIDGQDIRSLTTSSLRELFGVVPQDPSMFNTTIRENVRYARLEATDEEVEEACKAASLHDKIISFPDKYDTKVGERGVKLSGGELQRVAIARVILKSPRIVVLDEATSAIDSATEVQIQSAFRRLSAGRTTFAIAHRLSTIMDADLILVIEKGDVVERGTHAELLAKKGRYVELWRNQSAGRTSKNLIDVETGTLKTNLFVNDTGLATPAAHSDGLASGAGTGSGSPIDPPESDDKDADNKDDNTITPGEQQQESILDQPNPPTEAESTCTTTSTAYQNGNGNTTAHVGSPNANGEHPAGGGVRARPPPTVHVSDSESDGFATEPEPET